jgi:hypothetical protein
VFIFGGQVTKILYRDKHGRPAKAARAKYFAVYENGKIRVKSEFKKANESLKKKENEIVSSLAEYYYEKQLRSEKAARARKARERKLRAEQAAAPGTTIAYRDTQGHFAPASRAKYYAVYEDGKLLFKSSFRKASDKLDSKEDEVIFALSQFYSHELLRDAKIADALKVRDKKRRVEKVKLAEEEKFEPFVHATEYAEVKKRKRLSFKESREENYIVSRPDKLNAVCYAEKFFLTLDEPLRVQPHDLEQVKRMIKRTFVPKMREYWRRAKGARLFLVRITTKSDLDYNKQSPYGSYIMRDEGFGVMRTLPSMGESWKSFEEIILASLFEGFTRSMAKYLARSRQQYVTGFTMENIMEAQGI